MSGVSTTNLDAEKALPASRVRWVVTGAGGFLGNVVVRTLLDAGENVTAGVTRAGTPQSLAGLACEVAQIDVRNLKSLEAAFAPRAGEAVRVVHCAGIVAITAKVPDLVREVNVTGTKNVIAACRSCGVERLVHVSSVHAIAEPSPPVTIVELDSAAEFSADRVVGGYAKTKAEATAAVLEASDLWRVVVHPSGIIGPFDFGDSHLTRLVRDTASGSLRIVVDGGYDFVDVRDVALGIVAAANRGRNGRAYLLTGHYATALDLVREVARLCGRRAPRTIPFWIARLTAPIAERWYRMRGTKPLYTAYSLHTLRAPADFSHARASGELGYEPRTLSQTIADTVKWVAEEHSALADTGR